MLSKIKSFTFRLSSPRTSTTILNLMTIVSQCDTQSKGPLRLLLDLYMSGGTDLAPLLTPPRLERTRRVCRRAVWPVAAD